MDTNGSSLSHRIFAYGTLKSGQPNNHYLQNREYGHCQFVGSAITVEAFPLVIATSWNLPLLLFAPGKGQKVVGEVYDIDDKCLQWMDDFECHPNMYQRDKINVQLLSRANATTTDKSQNVNQPTNVDTTECWVYYLKKFEPVMLAMETYSCFNSLGEHGRVYIGCADRSDENNFGDELKAECERFTAK